MKIGERIALGTVQLGLRYGIANVHGKPFQNDALEILDIAWKLGIRSFDTAAAYGDSETVIGKWNCNDPTVRIVTKYTDSKSDATISERLQNGLDASLNRLQRDHLYGYLLHDASLVGKQEWVEGLAHLKESGLVASVGISVYTPEEAMAAVESEMIDIIQIPYNVFDQRLDECGFFENAAFRGKEIWARSVFLQGLLFLSEERIPESLLQIIPHRKKLEAIAKKYGLSVQNLALLFSLGNMNIDRVLIGVETKEQLLEYGTMKIDFENFSDCRSEIIQAFRGNVAPYLVSPQYWKLR